MPSRNQWMGLIRHLLTTLGGYLTASGVMHESDLQTVVAGAMVVIGIVLSYFDPQKSK